MLQGPQLRPAQRTQPCTLVWKMSHPVRLLPCPSHWFSGHPPPACPIAIFQHWRVCCSQQCSWTPNREKAGVFRVAAPPVRRWENPGPWGHTQEIDGLQTKGREEWKPWLYFYKWTVETPPSPPPGSPPGPLDTAESYDQHNLHTVWPSYLILNPSRWRALKYLIVFIMPPLSSFLWAKFPLILQLENKYAWLETIEQNSQQPQWSREPHL